MIDYPPSEARMQVFKDEFAPILQAVREGKIKETNLPKLVDLNNLGIDCARAWEEFKNILRLGVVLEKDGDLEDLRKKLTDLAQLLNSTNLRAGENANVARQDNLHFFHWMKNKITPFVMTLDDKDHPKTQVVDWIKTDMEAGVEKYLNLHF